MDNVKSRSDTSQTTNLYEIAGDVTTSNVKPASKMWQRKAIVDRADVCDTITRVDDYTSLQS